MPRYPKPDVDAMDFFRDDGLVGDPYPYFEACASSAPYGANPTTT